MSYVDPHAAWRAPAPTPPPISTQQYEKILAVQAALGWTAEQRAAYLTDRWGYTHACQLDSVQAAAFLAYLQEQRP